MKNQINNLSQLNLAFSCEFEPEDITEAEKIHYEDMQNEADYERESYRNECERGNED